MTNFFSIKRVLFSLTILIVSIQYSMAQTASYSLHTIKDNETLSKIAKENNTTVGDIMRLNGMNSNSKLKIGAAIKIPAAVTTAVTTPTTKVDPNLGIPTKPTVEKPAAITTTVVSPQVQPTIYTVVKGDNLYALSKRFKVTEPVLLRWNGLSNDKLSLGQKLIVAQPSQETIKPTQKDTFINKLITPIIPSTKAMMPTVITVKKKDSTAIVLPVPQAVDTIKVIKKDTLLVTKLALPIKPISTSIDSSAINIDTKPILAKVESIAIPKYAKYVNEEGYFAGYFNRKNISSNSIIGDAGMFKSASGWNDQKYYVLLNDVSQGTIVRITANNKSICAKVMGPLPTIKEDNGYTARISAAAAAALGIQESKFAVTINY